MINHTQSYTFVFTIMYIERKKNYLKAIAHKHYLIIGKALQLCCVQSIRLFGVIVHPE